MTIAMTSASLAWIYPQLQVCLGRCTQRSKKANQLKKYITVIADTCQMFVKDSVECIFMFCFKNLKQIKH